MLKISLRDGEFVHHMDNGKSGSLSSFPGHIKFPKHFEWDRDESIDHDICFFTEGCFDKVDSCKSKIKIAWIIEPRDLKPWVYSKIYESLYKKFDFVFTHDVDFINECRTLETSEKFKFCIFAGNWIAEKDWGLYPKTKNICILSSYKNELPGHKLRHEIINKLATKHNIEVFGNGYRRFDQTLDVLKDFMYCIVVENSKKNGWNTEKLFSPMSVGCIPLYWGDPLINYSLERDQTHMETGDSRIPEFNTIEELESLLVNCNEENYNDNYNTILKQINLESCKKYSVTEDWMWENVLKDIYKNLILNDQIFNPLEFDLMK